MPSNAARFLRPANRRTVLVALAAPAPVARPVAAKEKPCIAATPDLQSQIALTASAATHSLCGGMFSRSSPLGIDKGLTIIGTSTTALVGSGSGVGPVLTVGAHRTVRVSNVGITGGTGSTTPYGSGQEIGGGILNAGTPTLAKCRVRGNTARSGAGSFNSDHGQLTLDGTAIASNSAFAGGGGGIDNQGVLIAKNGTVIGGTHDGDGNLAHSGGGLYNDPLFGRASFAKGTKVTGNLLNCNGAGDCDGGDIYRVGSDVTVGSATLATKTIVTNNIYQFTSMITNCADVPIDNCVDPP